MTPSTPRGSSPLTRGKRRSDVRNPGAHGLIPAHAGKTSRSSCRWCSTGAHPRSRGENKRTRPPLRGWQGSSPLTRGKLNLETAAEETAGLIPAHAGKTRRRCGSRRGREAHPRSRGENHVQRDVDFHDLGSSPLTRGKHQIGEVRLAHQRLIPAHAGKTPRRCPGGPRTRAHPRSRGENASQRAAEDGPRGSSPLTRGKRKRGRARHRADGLIPAHAGKTARGARSVRLA